MSFDLPSSKFDSGVESDLEESGSEKITRNALFNVLGGALPSLVALLAVPFLLQGLGTERFGILTLLWMVLGYFTIFDLGVGRAMTKFVSNCLAQHNREQLSSMVWTGWIFLLALGVLGGAALFILTPSLVVYILKVPPFLIEETRHAFYAMAFSIPLLIMALGFRGVLEGESRFDLVNMVLIPSRIANYGIPLILVNLSPHLGIVALGLLLNQVLTCVAYGRLCLRSLPELRSDGKFDVQYVKPLIGFGGWLTISSVVSPVMQYFDRFFIGSLLSISAVAYYTTPYEAISKLLVFPIAITAVFFPVFSGLVAKQNPDRSREMLLGSSQLLIFLMTPLVIALVVLAEDILYLWVGREFAQQSAQVFKWLAFGLLFLNALGRLLTNWIHAHGRPDITAKFHLVELPLYLGALWFLLQIQGIKGAAIACVLRLALDTLFLLWFSAHLLPVGRSTFVWRMVLVLSISFGVYFLTAGLSIFASGLLMRVGILMGLLSGYALLVWKKLLGMREKQLLLRASKRLFHRFGVLLEMS